MGEDMQRIQVIVLLQGGGDLLDPVALTVEDDDLELTIVVGLLVEVIEQALVIINRAVDEDEFVALLFGRSYIDICRLGVLFLLVAVGIEVGRDRAGGQVGIDEAFDTAGEQLAWFQFFENQPRYLLFLLNFHLSTIDCPHRFYCFHLPALARSLPRLSAGNRKTLLFM